MRLLLRPELPALIFFCVLVAVFTPIAPGFLTAQNLQQVIVQVAIIGIIAAGVNQVILAGEIDVSVGSGLALCAWASGSVALSRGGILLPLLVSLGVGAGIGVINGLLTVKARIPSIIVTLGMLYAIRGVENVLNAVGLSGIPMSSRGMGLGSILGVNVEVIVFVLVFAVVAVIMRHTAWGRETPAVGGNRRAARHDGVNINGIRFGTFILSGLCVGVAAMVYVGQVAAVQSGAETGLELQVIAAVVIGGTSISGGRGSTLAAVAGAIVIGTMLDGMSLLGIVERWQDVFTGGVILFAVGSDVVRRRLVGRLVGS
jgi:ribose/xylose/arabinose/galactoside ABC-type transport system permease subunit